MQLPVDRPRPAEPTFRGARIFAQLAPPLIESLRRVAHSQSATLFMVLLGAFKVLLSRYSGKATSFWDRPWRTASEVIIRVDRILCQYSSAPHGSFR